jgi:hypothetical protein
LRAGWPALGAGGAASQLATRRAEAISAKRPFAQPKRGAGRPRGAGSAYPRQDKSRALGPTVTTTLRLTAWQGPKVATSASLGPDRVQVPATAAAMEQARIGPGAGERCCRGAVVVGPYLQVLLVAPCGQGSSIIMRYGAGGPARCWRTRSIVLTLPGVGRRSRGRCAGSYTIGAARVLRRSRRGRRLAAAVSQ